MKLDVHKDCQQKPKANKYIPAYILTPKQRLQAQYSVISTIELFPLEECTNLLMLYIITGSNLIKLHLLSEKQSVSISLCICVVSVSECEKEGTVLK